MLIVFRQVAYKSKKKQNYLRYEKKMLRRYCFSASRGIYCCCMYRPIHITASKKRALKKHTDKSRSAKLKKHKKAKAMIMEKQSAISINFPT